MSLGKQEFVERVEALQPIVGIMAIFDERQLPGWADPSAIGILFRIGRCIVYHGPCSANLFSTRLLLREVGVLTLQDVTNFHSAAVREFKSFQLSRAHERFLSYPASSSTPGPTPVGAPAEAAAAPPSCAVCTATTASPPALVAVEAPTETPSNSSGDSGADARPEGAETVAISDMKRMLTALFKNYHRNLPLTYLDIGAKFFSNTDLWRQPWFWEALYEAHVQLRYGLLSNGIAGQFLRVRSKEFVQIMTPRSAELHALALCEVLKSTTSDNATPAAGDFITIDDAKSLVRLLFENMTRGHPEMDLDQGFLYETNLWSQQWFIFAMFDAKVYLRFDPNSPLGGMHVSFVRFTGEGSSNHVTREMAYLIAQTAQLAVNRV